MREVVNTVRRPRARRMDTADTAFAVATGKFVLSGPMGDAGLTTRSSSTLWRVGRHGGGRSRARIRQSGPFRRVRDALGVKRGRRWLAERVEVQVAYAIGKAAPVGLFVETFGSETVDPARIEKAITSVFDLRPGAIIRDLDLLRPIYAQTAAYGHFGRTDIELPWEQTNKVDELKASV
jgi:S-adenosylmethionine synthetase